MRPNNKTPTSSVTTPNLLADTTIEQTMSVRQVRHVPIVVEGGKVIENVGEEANVFRIEFEEIFTQDLRKKRGRRNLSGKNHSCKCCHNLGFKGISESKPKDCNKDNQVMDYSIQKVRSIWPENYDTIQLMQPKYLTNAPYKEENYFLKLKSKEFPSRNQCNRESPSAKSL